MHAIKVSGFGPLFELYYHGGQADLNWWGTVRIVAGMCASVP